MIPVKRPVLLLASCLGTYWLPFKETTTGIQNHRISILEFTALVCNMRGCSQPPKDQYFDVLVDHNAFEIYERERKNQLQIV